VQLDLRLQPPPLVLHSDAGFMSRNSIPRRQHLRHGRRGGVLLNLRLQPLPLVHRVCQLAEAVGQLPPCVEDRKLSDLVCSSRTWVAAAGPPRPSAR